MSKSKISPESSRRTNNSAVHIYRRSVLLPAGQQGGMENPCHNDNLFIHSLFLHIHSKECFILKLQFELYLTISLICVYLGILTLAEIFYTLFYSTLNL